jgi:hypothetical protein
VLGGIARVPDTGGAETRLSRLVDRVEAAVARLDVLPA